MARVGVCTCVLLALTTFASAAAQTTAAPFNATLLGTVSTFINVSGIPSSAGGNNFLYDNYNAEMITKRSAQMYCQTGAPAFPVVETTIQAAHEAMMAGNLTCSQLVSSYIQRISAYDRLTNSVRLVVPDIMSTAATMDTQLAAIVANGTDLPLLFCVPILVKDNFDALDGGVATANGAVALLDNMPKMDSTEVAQAKAKGAIILAHGNMAEWAFTNAISIGSAYGVVRNPYSLDRSTAGSSGGPAAGAAASYAMISMGTDTGNSIRGPSGHQGLVGLRSSIGQTSRAGIIPLQLNRDIGGPIGRTVSDVATLFTALTDFSMFPEGFDPRDPVTAFRLNYTHPSNYTQFLNPNGLKGKRIGVISSIANNPNNDADVNAHFAQAIADLTAAGATVVENFTIVGNSLGDKEWSGYIPITSTADNGTVYNTGAFGFNNGSWYTGNGSAGKWESISQDICPNFREDLETYLSTSGSNSRTLLQIYEEGLYHPSVTQSITGPLFAPSNFSTADVLQQPSSKAAGFVCTCGEFYNNPCRMEIRARLIESMDAMNLDAFIYPGWGNPPRLIGDLSQSGNTPLGDFSQGLLPATGAPGIVVPMGLHDTLGTPTTLQIGARPFNESTLIEIAYGYEQATMHRAAPQLFPECTDPVMTTGPSSTSMGVATSG
ncbi:hypothetical protein ABBQ38_009042 [Trebouxia sp. C0009 RCD-2024]